eukprot:Nitzschia sp. Nitz4//scaffold49_size126201//99697//100260//NITZ4_003657-RA/size126201-processed-gene-0.77-mRNA-1//1//CDS//3329553194//2033//frame0
MPEQPTQLPFTPLDSPVKPVNVIDVVEQSDWGLADLDAMMDSCGLDDSIREDEVVVSPIPPRHRRANRRFSCTDIDGQKPRPRRCSVGSDTMPIKDHDGRMWHHNYRRGSTTTSETASVISASENSERTYPMYPAGGEASCSSTPPESPVRVSRRQQIKAALTPKRLKERLRNKTTAAAKKIREPVL